MGAGRVGTTVGDGRQDTAIEGLGSAIELAAALCYVHSNMQLDEAERLALIKIREAMHTEPGTV
jgi:hypothetical protein